MNDDDLANKINDGHCPDCDYRGFIIGPRGGAAINIECASLDCRSRFNVVNFGGRIMMAQRIPKQSDGGSDWQNIIMAAPHRGETR
jgi:hypothetical protein